ncbi:MAG: hypothetical protein LUD44_02735 [Firmicutes bacterium]|nr:hypothetical protein [Bacillota bacterium]
MKYIKFYAVKLLILIINAVCSALLSYMFALTLSAESSTAVIVFYYLIPMLFFFCFTFTLAKNIKAPEDEAMRSPEYFAKFALREASVYMIFLLPLLIAGLIGAEISGAADYLYRPHSFLLIFMNGAVGALLNFAAVSVIYGAVSAAAHYMKGIETSKATAEAEAKAAAKAEAETSPVFDECGGENADDEDCCDDSGDGGEHHDDDFSPSSDSEDE